MKKKKQPVTYGRGQISKFRSPEQQARFFDKKAKEQAEKKEKKEGSK